ncbi:MAG TPA: hypothetical protein VK066_20770 [Chloroflexota bacterium]|nr:hypothetical protein [Chloroflexota bacterium]
MTDETPAEDQPIVAISQLCWQHGGSGRGKRATSSTSRCTVYGVDANSVERVYVEHETDEEHQAWMASDPLWREAQRALFDRLLSNPATRDMVLLINIQGALEKGDDQTAIDLAKHLSPERLSKLLGRDAE